jgi:hypothetical protein
MKKIFSILMIALVLSVSFAQEEEGENGCEPTEVTVWSWKTVYVGFVPLTVYLPTTYTIPCPQS